MADTSDNSFDLIVVGGGPGGYVAAIRAAQLGLKDRAGRARASRRHLPQLGLHPDQGIAAHVGNLPPDAACRRFRPVGGQCFLRYRQGGETVAQGCRPAQRRRQTSDEEEQGRGVRRPRPAGRQGQARRRQGRQGNRHPVVAPHRPRHRRKGAHAAGPRARRHGHLDLQGSHGAGGLPEIAFDRRQRRHRHRVRQLLPHAGRRGDGRRNARPYRAGRGRGNLGLRAQGNGKAGHEDSDRRDGSRAREGRGQG